MKWKDISFWYDNYELQATEEKVVDNLSYDKKTGKTRELPSQEKIRKIVDKEIAERRRNLNGIN